MTRTTARKIIDQVNAKMHPMGTMREAAEACGYSREIVLEAEDVLRKSVDRRDATDAARREAGEAP